MLGTPDGTILDQTSWPTRASDGAALFEAIVQGILDVESYGAASALPKLARRIDPAFDATTGAEVAARAAQGDAVAQAAIEQNAAAVGAACAMLADLLVLDVIVLGSLASYLGEPWIDRVRAQFAREALRHHVAACTVRAASLPNVQDLSGIAAALHTF